MPNVAAGGRTSPWLPPPPYSLGAQDSILAGFRDGELDRGLGGDLYGFAGGGVAADPRLALREFEDAEAWKGDLLVLLHLFVGDVGIGRKNIHSIAFYAELSSGKLQFCS